MKYSQKNNNTGQLKFYGEVSEWWNSASDFTATLAEMELKYQNIDIHIHCRGGSVFEGNVIFNAIAGSKANITVYIDGIAASMASIIMLAAKKVIAAPNAFIMIHSPSGYTSGPSQEHFNTGKLLRSMEKNFAKAYAKKTGKDESEVAGWMDSHDHWFSADEALAAGLVDEIGEAMVENVQDLGKPDKDDQVLPLFSKYAALLSPPSPVNEIPKNKTSTMKKDLIKSFNLGISDDASDAAVLQALTDKFGTLENAVKDQKTAQINMLIETAEDGRGGQFDEKIREQLVAIGTKAGVEALSAALRLAPPATEQAQPTRQAAPQIVSMLSGKKAEGADPKSGWDWDKFQAEDPEALEEMETKAPDRFAALYKAKYKTAPPA